MVFPAFPTGFGERFPQDSFPAKVFRRKFSGEIPEESPGGVVFANIFDTLAKSDFSGNPPGILREGQNGQDSAK